MRVLLYATKYNILYLLRLKFSRYVAVASYRFS